MIDLREWDTVGTRRALFINSSEQKVKTDLTEGNIATYDGLFMSNLLKVAVIMRRLLGNMEMLLLVLNKEFDGHLVMMLPILMEVLDLVILAWVKQMLGK